MNNNHLLKAVFHDWNTALINEYLDLLQLLQKQLIADIVIEHGTVITDIEQCIL